jgi:hypothetical protein
MDKKNFEKLEDLLGERSRSETDRATDKSRCRIDTSFSGRMSMMILMEERMSSTFAQQPSIHRHGRKKCQHQ